MTEKSSSSQDKNIILQVIEDEMKTSYLDYAMSVIVGRALPDARDGLKPVHRRILFAMNDLGMHHNTAFKKCARIVGEVLGKYHPHGDTAVYDSLVRMAQDFSLRYPLVQGQGNFGSVDGDNPAAMRYCVTGDTLILTDKGILPISNISSKKVSGINMKILTYNGKKKSASKFFNSGKHSIIELETALGYKIRGSWNHPLLCWTLKNRRPQIEWKTLERIRKSDVVILNRGFSLFSRKNSNLSSYKPNKGPRDKLVSLPVAMTCDLAFLLGALVSEGSFHQHKIIFNNSDLEFYKVIKEIIFSLFRGITISERKIQGNCLELEFYHKQAVDFLINIGLNEVKSHEKEIPFSVLCSSKNCVVAFLKGLFEGDGSVQYKTDRRHGGKSLELAYHSKSQKLIEQLKNLLLNFGIITTKPYLDKRHTCYKLQITGYESIKKFKEEIGFFSERKKERLGKIESMNPYRMSKTDFIPRLADYLRKKYKVDLIQKNNFDRYNNLKKNYLRLTRIINGDDRKIINMLLKQHYLFDTVRSINKTNKKEAVFSIKVNSKCHSFVANGFISHNTEARLSRIASEMLSDIDKETVKFVNNFDATLKEPTVLPSRIPNLLVNGSSGIAVGMATNIPPHNIKEVCKAVIAVIDHPEIDVHELNKLIPGPDFPTGGEIIGRNGILQAYSTGRGKLLVRGKIDTEEAANHKRLIISEIPYQLNKSQLVEEIAENVREKRIEGVSDIRDESDRTGMRIVIELKANTNPEVVMNQLLMNTRVQETFGIIFLALIDNQPRVLPLKDLLNEYLHHRQIIVRKRTEFEMKKAKERAHILEGLIIALNDIDNCIALIKRAKSVEEARDALMRKYKLSEIQSMAILDMKLQKLTNLEQDKIRQEHKDLLKLIQELTEILASEKRILDIIKKEMLEIIEKYGDERKTRIGEGDVELLVEDMIEEQDMIVTVSHAGYIKRTPLDIYKTQKRGGTGVIGATTKEEDFIEHLFMASTHSYLLIFTSKGRVYWKKVYEIPEGGRQSKGKAIINLVNIEQDEHVRAVIPIKEFDDKHYLIFSTKKGLVKKTELEQYSRPRQGGIIAISLDPDDDLVSVRKTDGSKQLIIASKKGMAVKFNESNVRPMGRSAHGVRGIRLRQDDGVIGMVIAQDDKKLLTITENGFGKKTEISDYRLINRGGSGVINIKCTERNGDVVSIVSVSDQDDIMFVSKNGIIIRTNISGISTIGRNTQGFRLMKMRPGDKVMNAAKTVEEKEEIEENGD